jgi:glycogen(starch) synthase
MRIAYITFEYPPDSAFGGIATYAMFAARLMQQRGHDVEVFASSPTRNCSIENSGILLHLIREDIRTDFGILAGHKFFERHSKNPFHVIEGPDFMADARKANELVPSVPLVVKMHTPSILCHELNCESARKTSIRKLIRGAINLISDIKNGNTIRPIPVSRWHANSGDNPIFGLDAVELHHARLAQIVSPPCQSLADFAQTRWKLPQEKIRIVQHPYDPSPQYLSIQTRDTGYAIGFVGRLERRKGIEVLGQAIPRILDLDPRITLVFAGSDQTMPNRSYSYSSWLKERAGERSNRLEFLGRISLSEMPKVYSKLDICLFPSLWENFPNVCLEAMAAGKAIVGTIGGGMVDMLDNGKAGLLCHPGDPDDLVSKTKQLINNTDLRHKLGDAARKRVLEEFNGIGFAKKMEFVFQEAVESKRQGR